MNGRVALVTGAARGIGAATVAALCTQGYTVTAVDSCAGKDTPAGLGYRLASQTDLDQLTDRFGDRVLPIRADVHDAGALQSAVVDTLTRFGRLDAAVAAAGVLIGGQPQWQTPAEHLATLFDVNAVGVWNAAAAVIPAMLSGPDPAGCRFVAVASVAGERGLLHLAGYNASKHAVLGIVRGLAADLTGTGVTAVAVSPGSTRTAMLEATASVYGATVDELAEHQRIRRLLAPEEIAATIALCCSPDGSALNGSAVNADGGFTG
jgi:SDR family mycofactocin-dependent oxidoreductase